MPLSPSESAEAPAELMHYSMEARGQLAMRDPHVCLRCLTNIHASLRKVVSLYRALLFLFFNDTPTTELYTLSLHDALPICRFALGAAPRLRARAGQAAA